MSNGLMKTAIAEIRGLVATAAAPLNAAALVPPQEGTKEPTELWLYKLAIAGCEWEIVLDENMVRLKKFSLPFENFVTALTRGLNFGNYAVSDFSALALGRIGRWDILPVITLLDGLHSNLPMVRQSAAHGLSYATSRKIYHDNWNKDKTSKLDGRCAATALWVMSHYDPDLYARARALWAYGDVSRNYPELAVTEEGGQKLTEFAMQEAANLLEHGSMPSAEIAELLQSGRFHDHKGAAHFACEMVQVTVAAIKAQLTASA